MYRVVLVLRPLWPLTFLPVAMCESHKTTQAQRGVLAGCVCVLAQGQMA